MQGEMNYHAVMLKSGLDDSETRARKKQQVFHKSAILLILAAMGILFWIEFGRLMMPRADFYNELWAPAWLLVHGQSPYDTAPLDPILPAAWFPMAIGFFSWLGLLDENIALKIWFALNIAELCAVIFLAQGEKRSLWATAFLGVMCFFFPPTLYHFILGQISITVTLSLILALFFIERGRGWLAAMSVALSLSKPHLVILAGLGLSVYLFRQKGRKGIFIFWGQIFTTALALCVPLFIAYPNWIPDAVRSMMQNPIWDYPSLFVLFRRYFNQWGILLWGVVSLLTIYLNLTVWRKLSPLPALYWSLALAPLLSPYVGSWDFVVLLPLLMYTFVNIPWPRKFLLAVSYCIAWIAMARIQLLDASHNHYFWWVPLWGIAMVGALTWRRKGQ